GARSDEPRSVNHWLPAASIVSSAPVSPTFARSHSRACCQVSVHATRCAPFSSPVSSCSSRSSATVRFGSSGIKDEPKLLAMSILIKGGRVITASDDYVADVFVEDERISLIGESLDVQAHRVIDAS